MSDSMRDSMPRDEHTPVVVTPQAVRRAASTTRIAAGLWEIITVRAEVMGADLTAAPPSREQIRTAFLALMVETVELLNELPWKPWRRGQPVDPKKLAHEFADVLAFLAIIMSYFMRDVEVTPVTLAEAYVEKMEIVGERMKGAVDGYEAENQRSLDS